MGNIQLFPTQKAFRKVKNSLEHLSKASLKAIKRIYELLKPNGIFISVTPCLGERLTFLGFIAIVMNKLRLLPYLKKFRFAELSAIINDDFNIIEKTSLDSLQYVIVAKK